MVKGKACLIVFTLVLLLLSCFGCSSKPTFSANDYLSFWGNDLPTLNEAVGKEPEDGDKSRDQKTGETTSLLYNYHDITIEGMKFDRMTAIFKEGGMYALGAVLTYGNEQRSVKEAEKLTITCTEAWGEPHHCFADGKELSDAQQLINQSAEFDGVSPATLFYEAKWYGDGYSATITVKQAASSDDYTLLFQIKN